MKLIANISYSDMDFKFISDHYDLHLNGSCIYNNELCEFKTIVGDWNEDNDKWDEDFCDIYKLNFIEKFKWLYTQWSFEQCVGYHYSYDVEIQSKTVKGFYYRNPKWLYKLLFNVYYKINKL